MFPKCVTIGKGCFLSKFQIITFILVSMILTLNTNAYSGDDRFSFRIPPQNVKSALKKFADQTDLSLVYKFEDLGVIEVNKVAGRYSPIQALEIMLKDTGLVFEQTGEETIAILKDHQQAQVDPQPKADVSTASNKKAEPLSAASEAKNTDTATQHDKVSEPEAEKAEGETSGDYMLEELIVTASKRPRKLQEVPISIYALTGQMMESSGINSIQDIGNVIGGLETVGVGDGT
ncbi:MAG: STN domain-containing protein, partial [Deltaproteobacteria bacterium]|nr:STN domain-containing protein [Deltaproteobacteria bacterium]